MSPEERWRAAAGLTWVQFDDSPDWVVYNAESGAVHLLSDTAHALWAAVSSTPAISSTQLAAILSTALTSIPSSALAEAIADTLAIMDSAGLLQPVDE